MPTLQGVCREHAIAIVTVEVQTRFVGRELGDLVSTMEYFQPGLGAG